MRPGHAWDSTDGAGRPLRNHAGPIFGRWVSICSIEFDDRTVDGFGIDLDDFEAIEGEPPFTVEQARQYAADLLAAVEWLEAYR
jgi:hypothetical protein